MDYEKAKLFFEEVKDKKIKYNGWILEGYYFIPEHKLLGLYMSGTMYKNGIIVEQNCRQYVFNGFNKDERGFNWETI